MKDFLKMTLAVITGVLVVSILCVVFCLGMAGSMAALGSGSNPLPKSGILTIDLSETVIAEQSEVPNPLSSISAQGETTKVGVLDAVRALNIASEDPAVKFVYLKSDGNLTGLANLSELRKALQNFRTSGKPVISYIESPTTGSYYISSVSDKIFMTSHPGSMVSINGIGSQMIFLGDLLDKLGVKVQLIRHGKYKSAGEMFVRNSPSQENLEQYEVMINSLWTAVSSEIADSRGISVQELNGLVDELKLNLPEDLLQAGLVDEVLTRDQLHERLASLAVVDDYKDVEQIALADYVAAKVLPGKAHKKIAVIYADGEIVDGADKKNIAGDRFSSIIEKVRKDSTVKAVVLRVNSPGGAVLAADKLKNELDLLKAEKPLVASYGAYAASGGYWISACADKIFSDAVTLTGSIGVFSMIPDFSKAAKDIAHVGITTVGSNKHSDMFSLTRPLDKEEYDYMLRSVEDIYDRFTGLVAQGRGMEQDAVDDIAQGRVWAGSDALNIGLVDEIGTLEDAVRYAAVCADDPELSNWAIKGYPKPAGPMDQLMEMFGTPSDDDVRAALLRQFKNLSGVRTEARLPYEISIVQ